MLPIPGTGSVRHLEENIAAAAIRLDAGEVADRGDRLIRTNSRTGWDRLLVMSIQPGAVRTEDEPTPSEGQR